MSESQPKKDSMKIIEALKTKAVELMNKISVTQQDLARREVAEAASAVKRLQDLAAHHRDLALIYQNGTDQIRGRAPLHEVVSNHTTTTTAKSA